MSDANITLVFVGQNKAGAAINDVDSGMRRIERSADRASAAMNRTALSSSQIKKIVQDAAKASVEMGNAGHQAGLAMGRAAGYADRNWNRFFETARSVRATLAILAGFKLGSAIIGNAIQLTDAYTNMNSKLRTISETEEDINRIREKGFDIAQRTRTGWDTTITLYSRMTRATEKLNLSEQQRLAITETITKAYSLSGATVQEATNSIIQLTQGLASGTLRGEEFNSVAEQGPILLELLSKSLNMTRGELRAFAKEGGLTAEVITKALLEGQRTIDEQFSMVSVTIEGAAQRVVNSWQKLLGEMNEAKGTSRTVVDGLMLLAENLNLVVDAALALSVALGGYLIGKITAPIKSLAAEYMIVRKATLDAAAATRAATVASIHNAEALAAANTVRAEELSLQARTAELSRARAINDIRSAEMQIVKNEAALQSNAIMAAQIRAEMQYQTALVATLRAQLANAEAYKFSGAGAVAYRNIQAQIQEALLRENSLRLTLTETLLAEDSLRAQGAAAMNAQNAAHNRLNASIVAETNITRASNAAQFEAMAMRYTAMVQAQNLAKANTIVARSLAAVAPAFAAIGSAVSKVFNLLGGWVTVVIAAGYALWSWVQPSDEAKAATDRLSMSLEQLREKNESLERQMNKGASEQTKAAVATSDLTMKTVDSIRAQIEAEQANVNYLMSTQAITGSLGLSAVAAIGFQAKIALLNGDIEEAIQIQKEYNEELRKFRLLTRFDNVKSGVATTAIDPSPLDGERLDKILQNYKNQTIAIQANTIAKEQGRLAEIQFRLEQELGRGAWDKLTEAQRNSFIEYARLKDAEDALKESKKGGTDATREAEKALREQAKTMEALSNAANSATAHLSPLEKAQEDYVKGLVDIREKTEAAIRAGNDVNAVNEMAVVQIERLTNSHNAEVAAIDEKSRSLGRLKNIAKSVNDAYQQMMARNNGASTAQIQFNETLRDAKEAFEEAGGSANPDAIATYVDTVTKARDIFLDAGKAGRSLGEILEDLNKPSQFQTLLSEINTVKAKMAEVRALFSGEDLARELKPLERALGSLQMEMVRGILSSAATYIQLIQKTAKEGSKQYRQMEIALAALSVAQDIIAMKEGVTAILTQGKGDPYSAWARMAAMAGVVIPLLASIGVTLSSLGGASKPSAQSAEVRQEHQGTGSVLGDLSAKSESIVNAVEITASATEKLVGINRGMLTALQSLQHALGAAGSMIARGAGDVKFPNVGGGGLFLGLFGSSKTVIDQGIVIAGGRLNDMLNQIVVGAYQTIKDNGGFFGGTSYYDNTVDISGTFGKQFQLVIKSIVDTVREGALALGLLPEEIESRISQFQVEAIRISLKGLTGEEQQKELEAIFGKIFDDLSGAVVPWIEQFQQVGEGLGETLVRVATEVQVVREAFLQLGKAMLITDPEKIAQMSDELIRLAGGVDAFVEGLNTFIDAFATEEQKFDILQRSLSSAFEEVGLTIPSTREEMWELMQSLDGTTEAGRRQIATLLRLAGVADQYYDMLEDRATKGLPAASGRTAIGGGEGPRGRTGEQAASRSELTEKRKKLIDDMVNQIEEALDVLSKFGIGVGEGGNKLRELAQSAIDAVDAANLAAKAAGKQGAAEWELALIHRIAAARAAEAIAQLMETTQDLVSQFYNGISDTEDNANQAATSVRNFGSAMGKAAKDASDAINLLLGDLSPLNDQAKLQIALQALARGEATREDVLNIGRRLYASSQAYTDLFNRVMGMRVPGQGNSLVGGGGSNSIDEIAENTKPKTPEQLARERMDLALTIGQNVATLANAQGKTFKEIADMLGLNLDDLASALGLSNDELNQYLENLVNTENRTPDSIQDAAARIIRAMYDIAGKPQPVEPPTTDRPGGRPVTPPAVIAPPQWGSPPEPAPGPPAGPPAGPPTTGPGVGPGAGGPPHSGPGRPPNTTRPLSTPGEVATIKSAEANEKTAIAIEKTNELLLRLIGAVNNGGEITAEAIAEVVVATGRVERSLRDSRATQPRNMRPPSRL